MKDIKSLYLTAKSSGKSSDISAYTEAVNELLANNPKDYMLHLEYIISSDIGLETFDSFIEKYGLSLAAYDDVMACFEKCIGKCERDGKDASEYQKKKKKLKEFKEQHSTCFRMFETFMDDYVAEPIEENDQGNVSRSHRVFCKDPRHSLDVKKEYVDVYYSFNENGKQNSRLLVGMIDTFGECAIPDALITASKFGVTALDTSLKYLESVEDLQTAGHFQWISECTKEVAPEGYRNDILTEMESSSLQAIVDNMRSRNRAVFREATLSGNEDAVFEYSEEELTALSELISFKEYQLTCMENTADIVNLQKEVYSLYEEYDGLEGESAAAIADMLPPSSSGDGEMTESPWMVNTRNKKTGDAPSWLANNHNLDYNADDPNPKSPNDEESIEDFKRPSAGGTEPASDDTGSEYSNGSSDTSSSGQSSSGSTNNYYYYTYNNSLNKNNHSFNKDSSSHDNHSKHDHSVSNDSSVHNSTRRVTDDHSTNKRVHSHDYITPAPEDDNEDIQEESGKPWEVGNFLRSAVYTEGLFGNSKKKKKKNRDTTNTTPTTPVEHNPQYLPISEEERNSIIERMNQLVSEVQTFVKPISDKYPVYELQTFVDEDDLSDSFMLLYKPGYNIGITNGTMDMDAEIEILGLSQYDFSDKIIHKLPEEAERLKSLGYNLDDRHDWGNIQWSEKICGYDKPLEEICNEIVGILKTKFPMISGWDFMGDNDSGPTYAGNVDPKYLYPNYDPSRVITESVYIEDVGDADDLRPESDHPIKDTLMDVDRKLVRGGQKVKKGLQNVQNAGRAAMKPVNRATGWVGKVISDWKDADETKIKEKMADPHARNNLFSAIGTCIKTGSLMKAGLLFNPIFLFLSVTKQAGKNKNMFRIRNEMIGELKMEIEIIDKKIDDARANGDKNASYKLMRLKNELNKKLARVGGGKGAAKSL